jgi:hypothetical protein
MSIFSEWVQFIPSLEIWIYNMTFALIKTSAVNGTSIPILAKGNTSSLLNQAYRASLQPDWHMTWCTTNILFIKTAGSYRIFTYMCNKQTLQVSKVANLYENVEQTSFWRPLLSIISESYYGLCRKQYQKLPQFSVRILSTCLHRFHIFKLELCQESQLYLYEFLKFNHQAFKIQKWINKKPTVVQMNPK